MLHLYNYFSHSKEVFKPLIKNKVGMYLCGPTVYGEPHLGHARSAVVFDMLHRYFIHLGYGVRYVRNITDVGHLEDDVEETGEDKLAKRAKLEKREPMEIAQYYTNSYHDTLQKLNVLRPSIEPTASGHIVEQQDYIMRLHKKGWVYQSGKSLYFNLQKFLKDTTIYGTLSKKKTDDLLAGQRELVGQDEKHSSLDFALWKNASKTHSMKWKSPELDGLSNASGFPGWHIECSAMSEKYLGVPFDIHGGGLDLQFPHHEAEIAQCYALHEVCPANYWLYNNMITIDGRKMAKSLGNFITMEEFFTGQHNRLSRAYSPEIIRFFLLRSHYRSVLEVSDEALLSAAKGMEKLEEAYQKTHAALEKISMEKNVPTDDYIRECALQAIDKDIQSKDFYTQLCAQMNDDLNTPEVVATLFSMASNIIQTDVHLGSVYVWFCKQVLGLHFQQQEIIQHGISSDLIDDLLALRLEARISKNFELSDILRDMLQKHGVLIKDQPDGTSSWEYEK